MFRKALLAGGILSSLLYAGMTLLIPLFWPEYDWRSLTISELSAVDAPTRGMWILPGALYTVLIVGFGWGVRKSAGGNRALRTAGTLILVYGSLGLLWPFAPMHQREVLAAGGGTFGDTLHIALGAITVLLMLFAIGIGATAFGQRFRIYSIGSLAILFVFGVLTFYYAPNVGRNLPTPWLGVYERINLGVFLLWVAVLASALLSERAASSFTRAAESTPRAAAAHRGRAA